MEKENTETKEKKKMKVWQKILIVVLIIIFLFLLITIRKMIIVTDLQNKVSKYLELDNYYSKTYDYQGNNITISERYQKGDTYISSIKNISEDKDVGFSTYHSGNTTNVYFDTQDQKVALLNAEEMPSLLSLNDYLYTENLGQFVLCCINSRITNAQCNGKQCYKIEGFFSSAFLWLDGKQTMYIDKDTGLPVRIENGTMESNNEKINLLKDYFYEFNNVTNDDVKEPDITKYTIEENNNQ